MKHLKKFNESFWNLFKKKVDETVDEVEKQNLERVYKFNI